MRYVSNGTNLGKCIDQFMVHMQATLSPSVTTVLIFSDGWDRGDMNFLQSKLSSLRQQVMQIIWLNPLLGRSGYSPITKALEVTKPYVDHMVSAQDYASILSSSKAMHNVDKGEMII